MRFITFVRKLNAGTENRINKNDLQNIYELLNFKNVKVYINSGNVIFDTELKEEYLKEIIVNAFTKYFNNVMEIVIYNKIEYFNIVDQLPKEWENNENERTDVAFLFKKINSREILEDLPFNKDNIKVMYVNNALIWNLKKINLNKSKLSKLIGSELYKNMTMRNINTVRKLYNIMKSA